MTQDLGLERALNRTREIFAETPKGKRAKALKEIIGAAEVVIGAFDDGGALIIKGERALEEILRSERPAAVRFAAIPCKSPEEAAAMRKAFVVHQPLRTLATLNSVRAGFAAEVPVVQWTSTEL